MQERVRELLKQLVVMGSYPVRQWERVRKGEAANSNRCGYLTEHSCVKFNSVDTNGVEQ
jgi:hypothetical protein